ncbi:MAG: general secretion pathway protein GspC, partial [Legionella sp.]
MKLDIYYLFVAKYAKWIILSLISLFSILILYAWGSFFFSSSVPQVSS